MDRAREIWDNVLRDDNKNIKTSNWCDMATKAMNLYALEILENFKKRIPYSAISFDIELDNEIDNIKCKL